MLQRYKIQLENYEYRKNSILKQLKPLDVELAEIDTNIQLETKARHQAWLELFKNNRRLALPDPEPITNYQAEIIKCKTEIDTMSSNLSNLGIELESLKRKTLLNHASGQDVINAEIAIHKEEKDRISAKLADINNEYVNNIINLLEAKNDNNIAELGKRTELANTEKDILDCKNVEKQNRCIIIDSLRKEGEIRRNNKLRIVELTAEATQLTSEANELANLRNTTQSRLLHLTNLQSTNPSIYDDIIPEIETLQYQINNIDRKLSRITNIADQIQQEIQSLASIRYKPLDNISNGLIPIYTPYKDLIQTRNKLIAAIGLLQSQDLSLETSILNTNTEYASSIEKLQEEDQRANERLQIIITRCKEEYEYNNIAITDQIINATNESTNLKRQIFIKKKELENWNSAYSMECKYEFRKSKLLEQRKKLQAALDQVETDISSIKNIMGCY